MNKFPWYGQKDSTWKELSKRLKSTCNSFMETIRETESLLDEERKDLIPSEYMERFKSTSGALAEYIKDIENHHQEGIVENSLTAKKLNSWILLGSLMEMTLQIFLTFYLNNNYRDAKWQQWEDVSAEAIQKPIVDFINDMESRGNLESKHAKFLEEAVKHTIKAQSVQNAMFDELAQLFTSLDLFEEDELNYLADIQSNRDKIRLFQNRAISPWDGMKYNIDFFCQLMEWIVKHFLDNPEEAKRKNS